MVILFFFIISHLLSRYITRPLTELTKVSDEISRGVFFNVQPDLKNGLRQRGIKDEVRMLSQSFLNMAGRIQESQAKLEESKNKYHSLFASGPNPIFVIDLESLTILSANPRAEEIYGYAKRELVGRYFKDLGPFELDQNQWRKCNTQPSNVTCISAKVQCYKKNGEPLFVNIHASPTSYEDKSALIVATADISEMVEKDNQLIQASKMKTLGEMSAGIAHELNQPLNAVKMGSEFLEMLIEEKKQITQEILSQVVHEVSRQVDRAEGIIRRLRDFGRKADFTRASILVNDPICSILDIIGRQLRLQNIDIRFQFF